MRRFFFFLVACLMTYLFWEAVKFVGWPQTSGEGLFLMAWFSFAAYSWSEVFGPSW